MKTKKHLSHHENVDFEFYGGGEADSSLRGTAIVREKEMVLDIPGGLGPYLIVGKAQNHWFEGKNSAIGRQNEVSAKWANLGGAYVGIWIEAGDKFLFTFEIGNERKSRQNKALTRENEDFSVPPIAREHALVYRRPERKIHGSPSKSKKGNENYGMAEYDFE